MFAPPNRSETVQYLLQCAARAAQIKGLKNSEWLFEDEVLSFLKNEHPETFSIFAKFAEAFEKWADLARRTYQASTENKLDPFDQQELKSLLQNRDTARNELLRHLGLLK